MEQYLKVCYVQKTNRYGALDVWKELGMGDGLTFAYDKKGVNIEVKYKDITLGILSDEDAKTLKVFLDAGWNNPQVDESLLFKGKISKFDSNADENKRLEVAVFINGPQRTSNSNKRAK